MRLVLQIDVDVGHLVRDPGSPGELAAAKEAFQEFGDEIRAAIEKHPVVQAAQAATRERPWANAQFSAEAVALLLEVLRGEQRVARITGDGERLETCNEAVTELEAYARLKYPEQIEEV